MDSIIEVTGVTSIDSFPKLTHDFPCAQVCETDRLCIPPNKLSMESIVQISVKLSVCSHKVICTPIGRKLVIEGTKHIKVIYVADEPCQPVHAAHFEIPFCVFVVLKDPCRQVADVFTGIEFIKAHKLDCRNISVSVIIFACPIFHKTANCCNDCYNTCGPMNRSYDGDCFNSLCHDKCGLHKNCDGHYLDEEDCCVYNVQEADDDKCWRYKDSCTNISVNIGENSDCSLYIDAKCDRKDKCCGRSWY